jgi:hypothetical protein
MCTIPLSTAGKRSYIIRTTKHTYAQVGNTAKTTRNTPLATIEEEPETEEEILER